MSQTRRLAAILAADVAGYSRLMGLDEEGTRERLKLHRRELTDPKIQQWNGRVVKNTGDGLLAEFPSVVAAVRCAVEVQQANARAERRCRGDNRTELPIGINFGDIIQDRREITATASKSRRLEALAKLGGICRAGWPTIQNGGGGCCGCTEAGLPKRNWPRADHPLLLNLVGQRRPNRTAPPAWRRAQETRAHVGLGSRAEDSAAAGHRSFTPTCGRSWAQLAPQPSAMSGIRAAFEAKIWRATLSAKTSAAAEGRATNCESEPALQGSPTADPDRVTIYRTRTRPTDVTYSQAVDFILATHVIPTSLP
jgi:hypothetical protein